MSKRMRFVFAARLCFVFALLLLCASSMSTVWHEGVIVLNLNADLGNVRRGQELQQTVQIINCTFQPVHILSIPTCGCTVADSQDRILRPFGVHSVPIEYHVEPQRSGRTEHTIVILYRMGEQIHRINGTTCYNISP